MQVGKAVTLKWPGPSMSPPRPSLNGARRTRRTELGGPTPLFAGAAEARVLRCTGIVGKPEYTQRGWHDPINAELYAAFVEQYRMYREAGSYLAQLVGDIPNTIVIDLACGTGAGVPGLLEAIGPAGTIIGVDSSAAMLAQARRRVQAPNLTWVEAAAEDLDKVVAGEADVIVCNSAFWQTRMADVLAAVARALRRGGRFAFNMPGRDRRAPPEQGSFMAEVLAEAIATGWQPPERQPYPLDVSCRPPVSKLIQQAKLELVGQEEFVQRTDARELHAWLSIPIFATTRLPGMPMAELPGVLDRALARCDPAVRAGRRWTCYLCRRP